MAKVLNNEVDSIFRKILSEEASVNNAKQLFAVVRKKAVAKKLDLPFSGYLENLSNSLAEGSIGLEKLGVALQMLIWIAPPSFLIDNKEGVMDLARSCSVKSHEKKFLFGIMEYKCGNYQGAEENFAKLRDDKELLEFHQTGAMSYRSSPVLSNKPEFRCLESLTYSEAEVESRDAVVLLSCDIGYLKAYWENVVKGASLLGCLVFHINVILPAGMERERSKGDLCNFISGVDVPLNVFITMEEQVEGPIKTYTSISRYVVLGQLLKQYKKPILVSDVDIDFSKINISLLKELLASGRGYLRHRAAADFPWHKILAGFNLFPCHVYVESYADLLNCYFLKLYREGYDGWMLDQVGLYVVYKVVCERINNFDDVFYNEEAGNALCIEQVSNRHKFRKLAAGLKKPYPDNGAGNVGALLDLKSDALQIKEKLLSRSSQDFVVCLKTKDEPELIEKWILHYSNIFDFQNLIILDNGSRDGHVLSVYDKYKDRLGGLFRFSGPHNRIHFYNAFPDFYDALMAVTRYVAFFDTDEFLTYLAPNKCYSGEALYRKIKERAVEVEYKKAIHAFWLNNVDEHEEVFDFGAGLLQAFIGVRDGKYFIPSPFLNKFSLGHNVSTPPIIVPDDYVSLNFWLLHLKSSSISRRVRVNYNKISARDMFLPGVNIDDVTSMPVEKILKHDKNGVVNSYVHQIKELARSESPSSFGDFDNGSFLRIKGKKVSFLSNGVERVFLKFFKSRAVKKSIHCFFKNKFSYPLRQCRAPMIRMNVYGKVVYLKEEGVYQGFLLNFSEDSVGGAVSVYLNGRFVTNFLPTMRRFFENIDPGFEYGFNISAKEIWCLGRGLFLGDGSDVLEFKPGNENYNLAGGRFNISPACEPLVTREF